MTTNRKKLAEHLKALQQKTDCPIEKKFYESEIQRLKDGTWS